MSMTYDAKPKRRQMTYGKPARNRDQIFGFVNTDAEPSDVVKTVPIRDPHFPRTNKPRDAVALEVQSRNAASFNKTSMRKGQVEKEAARQAGGTKGPIRTRRETTPAASSLFEVPSSDDQLSDSRPDVPRKRRRLTPAKDTPRLGQAVPISVDVHQRRDDSSLQSQELGSQQKKPDNLRSRKKQFSRQVPKSSRLVPLKRTTDSNKMHDSPQPMYRHPTSPISEADSDLDLDMVTEVCIDSPGRSSPEPPVTPKSDRSSRSSRLHDLLDRHGVSETPSRLSIRGLRLSSEEASPSPPAEIGSLDRSPQPKQQPAARTRTRLVDTLSQSRHSLATSPTSPGEESVVFESSEISAKVAEPAGATSKALEGPENNPIVPKVPKITYATQRSYLSDMVPENGLEGSLQSFSQSSDLGIPDKGSLGGSFSQDVAFELLSDDEDDVNGPGAIRSIHELRKAGGNARFESNVESIFEDIESSTNGRRLSGLLQLCRKLANHDFQRQFLDHFLDRRLARCDASDGSMLGSTLTMSIFLQLLLASQTSTKTVERCMRKTMKFALGAFSEQRDILEIAKDRRQNLSKALRNDLRDFREIFVASEVWPDQKPVKLTPLLICLRAIESMIRRMRELGDFGVHIIPEVFRAIVDLLDANVPPAFQPDQVLIRNTTVSVLESFTVGITKLDSEYVEALEKLSDPSKLISTLSSSNDSQATPQAQELFLRFILNITNNNEGLCNAFAQPPLISTIFQLVRSSFNNLSTQDKGVTEASMHLNTVILSLGALINFAEWSSEVRRSMLTLQTVSLGDQSEPCIDWLVFTFNANVTTFLEASSASQSHTMVTFGYLSVLLTTICLDEIVRRHVRGRLAGGSLRIVFVAVEEFLKHMRKVEQDERMVEYDEEERANGAANDKMSDFAERFQKIVRELRRAERL